MIDWGKMKDKTTFFVLSIKCAEELICKFGLRYLIDVVPSKKFQSKKVYVFHNRPELLEHFRNYVSEAEEVKKQTVEEETIPVDLEEDEGKYPKPKKDRKKKNG